MTSPSQPQPAASPSLLAPTLPTLLAKGSPEAILAALDQLAHRGKMAGFHPGGPDRALFHITDFGAPFETLLSAHASTDASGTRLTFRPRLRPLMPLVFLAVLIITVWPGVWLTDSMLRAYFPAYGAFLDNREWATWMWYLPLTVPFVPISMWTTLKRSRASGFVEARQIIQKIATSIDAAVDPPSA